MDSLAIGSGAVGQPGVRYHRSPPLGALAIVFTALFLASLAVQGAMTGGAHYPTPYDLIRVAQAYYARNALAVRIASFLQFGAAIPLGLFTATVTSRLRFLGITAAGVTNALFGGIAASIFLAASGLAGWILSQPGVAADAGATRIMELFSFATGGPGHIAPLGLLLAGVSVPGLILRLLPRWIAWLGLIIAVIAELSTFCLVLPAVSILLPVARFAALVWLIGAGFALPRSKGVQA